MIAATNAKDALANGTFLHAGITLITIGNNTALLEGPLQMR
jgi:hypothetical protein